MKRRSIFLFFLIFSSTAISADSLYRWVDKNGNVSYSTSENAPPDAEKIPLATLKEKKSDEKQKPVNDALASTDEGAANKKEKKKETKYKSLSIVSPTQNQAIRENSGKININISLRPKLDKESEHEIVYSLDGSTKRSQSTFMSFSNIARGQHSIKVYVENKKGKPLIKSQTVSFQLHRFSRLFKK